MTVAEGSATAAAPEDPAAPPEPDGAARRSRLRVSPRGAAQAAVTALLWVLTLPGLAYIPIPGLDPSYRAALHMALEQGVRFGGEIVYTFGPLGFLGAPSVYDPTTYALGVAVALALHLTLVAVIVALLWRGLGPSVPGLAVAAVVAYPVARVSGRFLQQLATPELLTLLLMLAVLELLRRGRPAPHRAVLAGIAALSAAAMLVKFNNGAVPLAAVGVAGLTLPTGAVGGDRRGALLVVVQRAAACLGAAAAAFLGLWLLTGQRLGDLAPFVRDSLAISSGHIEAMATEEPGREWEYTAAYLLVAALVVVVALATRGRPALLRTGTLVVLAVYLAALFRHGFVRHDGGHAPLFFLPVLLLALLWLPDGWRPLNGIVALGATVAAFVMLAGAVPFWPQPSSMREVGAAVAAVVPSRQSDVVAAARDTLRGHYALSGETVALLSTGTVHVEPWETGVLWAYPELRWGTVPVFQPFVAYTEGLDQRNAAALTGPDAPGFILQEVAAVDRHNPLHEPPAYMLELVCNYERVAVDGRWQVLRRAADRCGEPEGVEEERLDYGEWSDAPTGGEDELVVARFRDLTPQPGDGLRALLLKPRSLELAGDPADPAEHWRFVQGHAGAPHLVSLPDCLDWEEPFRAGEPYEDLTLYPTEDPGPDAGGGFTVSYERIPFRC